MSLDQRVRVGLQGSADSGRLNEEHVLEQVRVSHRRGLVRAHVARQASAVMVILTLFVGVAVFVSWRTMPYRYRSVATVSVEAPSIEMTGGLPVKLADPRQLALAPSTRRAALLASALPEDARVDFRVTEPHAHLLSFTTTAPTASNATLVARHWVAALARLRNDDARRQIPAAMRALSQRVETLHRELRAVDAKLAKVDPINYGAVLRYDGPTSPPGPKPPPNVPERGSVHELNLAFERIQILEQLKHAGLRGAELRIAAFDPALTTKLLTETPPTRIDQAPPATLPAIAGWFIVVALVLTGAFIVYRRRAQALLR